MRAPPGHGGPIGSGPFDPEAVQPPASQGGWRGPGMEPGTGMEPGEGARGEILRRCLIFRSHDDGSRSSTSIPALLK